MNFFQYRCELVAKVPRTWCRTTESIRYRCLGPGKASGREIPQRELDLEMELKSGFTLMMEAFVMLLSAEMPVDAMCQIPN